MQKQGTRYQKRFVGGNPSYYMKHGGEVWTPIHEDQYQAEATPYNTDLPPAVMEIIDAIERGDIRQEMMSDQQQDAYGALTANLWASVNNTEYYDPDGWSEADFESIEEFEEAKRMQENWSNFKSEVTDDASCAHVFKGWLSDYQNEGMDNAILDIEEYIVIPASALSESFDQGFNPTRADEYEEWAKKHGDYSDLVSKFKTKFNENPPAQGHTIMEVVVFPESELALDLPYKQDANNPHLNFVATFKGDKSERSNKPSDQIRVIRQGIIFRDGSFKIDGTQTKSYKGRQKYRIQKLMDQVKDKLNRKPIRPDNTNNSNMEVNSYESIRRMPFLVNGHNPVDVIGEEMEVYMNTNSLASKIKSGEMVSKTELLSHLGDTPVEKKIRAMIGKSDVQFTIDREMKDGGGVEHQSPESYQRMEDATAHAENLFSDHGLMVDTESRARLNQNQASSIAGSAAEGNSLPVMKGGEVLLNMYFVQSSGNDYTYIGGLWDTQPIIWFENGEQVVPDSKVLALVRTHADNFEHGGNIDGNFYTSQVLPVLKQLTEEAFDEVESEWELYAVSGEEVEHQFRDGYIPYTDGGYVFKGFTDNGMLQSTGKGLPTKKLVQLHDNAVEQNHDAAKDKFEDVYPDIFEELGEDNIDYHTLYEKGYSSEAEELDEWERSGLEEDTVMFEIGAYYYTPSNSRNDHEGEHTVTVFGSINMEAPYHRKMNKFEDYVETTFTFKNASDLRDKTEKALNKVFEFMETTLMYQNGGMIEEQRIEIADFMERENPDYYYGLKVFNKKGNTPYYMRGAMRHGDNALVEVGSKSESGRTRHIAAETLYTTPDAVVEFVRTKLSESTRVKAGDNEPLREPEIAPTEFPTVAVVVKPVMERRYSIYMGDAEIASGLDRDFLAKNLFNHVQMVGIDNGFDKFNIREKRLAKFLNRMHGGFAKGGEIFARVGDYKFPYELSNSDYISQSNRSSYPYRLDEKTETRFYEELGKDKYSMSQYELMKAYADSKGLSTHKKEKGGGVNDRMYNFLKDDLKELHKAINEGNQEEIERFFSYWNQHLESLKTAQNDRMYNFLKDDLKELHKAINEGNQEEIERFFSYWNQHLESLKSQRKEDGGAVGSWKDRALADIIEYTDNADLVVRHWTDDERVLEVEDEDDYESYLIFRHGEDSEKYAMEKVREDLENEPELFIPDWLLDHVDEIAAEEFFKKVYTRWDESYAEDIQSESSDTAANRLAEEMLDWGIISEEVANDASINHFDEYGDEFVEKLVREKIEEGRGGYDHYSMNFGEEEAKKLIKDQDLIDLDEAARDAIRVDGVPHFLSSYDGEEIDLGDFVAYRTN